MSIDSIILAAGRNERLAGVLPPFMKPFILVNGETLLMSLIQLANRYVGRIIVVAAPENVQMIAGLLHNTRYEPNVDIVVQPSAVGPLDAVRRALPLCSGEYVNILCGDNVVSHEDLAGTVDRVNDDPAAHYAICTRREYEVPRALQFSRVTEQGGLIEGREELGVQHGLRADGSYHCWVGPVVARRARLVDAMSVAAESPLIRRLSAALDLMGGLREHEGQCTDIGTPGALPT